MSLRHLFAVPLMVIAVMISGFSAVPAVAAEAGWSCSSLPNARFHQSSNSGGLIFNSWYSSSHNASCWKARDKYDRRANFTVKIVKRNADTGALISSTLEDFRGVYNVGGSPNTCNRSVTVEVWMDPYDGKGEIYYGWGKIEMLESCTLY